MLQKLQGLGFPREQWPLLQTFKKFEKMTTLHKKMESLQILDCFWLKITILFIAISLF